MKLSQTGLAAREPVSCRPRLSFRSRPTQTPAEIASFLGHKPLMMTLRYIRGGNLLGGH